MVTAHQTRLTTLLLPMLCLLFSAGQAWAELSVRVDRNPVGLNESFTLTVSSDESLDEEPDFTQIDTLFEVVNRQQSNNFQMINGDISRSLSWQMVLLPRRAGRITIPPIHAGKVSSQPLELVVTEEKPATAESGTAGGEALFLEVEADPTQLYVQQQLLYTIKLYIANDAGIGLANGSSLSEPEMTSGEAVIKRLGEDSNYQTTHQGRRYSVIERRYAIYPQQSGRLEIAPIRFDGRMLEQGGRPRSLFDQMQQRSRIKRLVSKAVQREVKPIPVSFRGRTWLPAKNLQLLEEWPENRKLVAGEPITRTVALIADGLTSAQLPAITPPVTEGIKPYPDQPQLNENVTQYGISAVRQEKVAMIPGEAGRYTLPELTIRWWNTETLREEVSRLPPRIIEVAPATDKPLTPTASAAPTPAAAPIESDVSTLPHAAAASTVTADSTFWPWLSLLLALGWGTTLALIWRQHKRPGAQPPTQLQADLSEASKRLKTACRNHDPQAAKEALLDWGALVMPSPAPRNLGTIGTYFGGELATALDEMNQALYADTTVRWQGKRLLQAWKNIQPEQQKEKSPPGGLSPLFQHQ